MSKKGDKIAALIHALMLEYPLDEGKWHKYTVYVMKKEGTIYIDDACLVEIEALREMEVEDGD